MFHIETFTHWLSLHPSYGLFLSFLMAFAESLLFVGGIIPGSLAITAIGTLSGAGILPIYPTLVCAIIGAICGDFASFFIGQYYKESLRDLSFFKKYPKTLEYGEYYFKKHGAKSVFFARFIGPIRAIVPAIAGMLNMRVHHFIIANSISAVGWAILFFFPGVLIGRGHENIQKNITQIGLSIVFFVILPFVVVKLAYQIKRHIFPMFEKKINDFWHRTLKTLPILHSITPNHHVQQYHITVTECIILLLFLSLTLLSYLFPIEYTSTAWLQIPSIHPFTHHRFLYAFDGIAGIGILIVFMLFCLNERLYSYIYALLFIGGVLFSFYVLVLPQAFVFAITIAIQYLLLRTISRHKMHLYQFFYIFFAMFWTLATYLISINLDINTNLTLFLGLTMAQACWIVIRKHEAKTKYHQFWIFLCLLEPLLQFLR